MASLLVHALKGAHAEVLQEPGVLERLRKAGQLAGIFAQELGTAVGLAPYGIRSLRLKSSVPVAGTAAAACSPYGVVLYPAVPYGPKPRHLMDVYVPSHIYTKQQQERREGGQQQQQQQRREGQQQQQQQRREGQQQQPDLQYTPAASPEPLVPVVFFCHGGIWATGDRWHFGPMAVSLAQAGAVVAVVSYTLYPEALAAEMAAEVLAALVWTGHEIERYGGDPQSITVVGHSAGGHLASLAVMMLAQQRQHALAAAAAAPGQQGQQRQPAAAALYHRAQRAWQLQRHKHRRQKQLWYLPDVLSLPPVHLFIGMSSVYDVALHFEFESMRGVAGISTMARACGGAAMFDAVSPAVLLAKAAAAAAQENTNRAQQGVSHTRHHHQQQQQLQPLHWPELPAGVAAAAAAGYSFQPNPQGRQSLQRFTGPGYDEGFAINPDKQAAAAAGSSGEGGAQLHGEVIPLRSGMEQTGQQAGSSSRCRFDEASNTGRSTASSSGMSSAFFGNAAELLADFSLQDAAQMPPCIMMSSCGDHMVPWHEGAHMALALRRCGVPAKHLIYDRYLHNDFVMDWTPVTVETGATLGAVALGAAAAAAAAEGLAATPAAAAVPAAGRGGAAEVTSMSSNSSTGSTSVPAFAQDLINIITGKVRVQFNSSNSSELLPKALDGEALAARVDADVDASIRHLRLGPWFSTPRPHSRL